MNKILNRKTLSEGAGQVRAISRLALNTAIKAGKMTPLHQAVEQLYKLNGESTMQAMRVILVGSLCGGTGSGLILPVSMYIRNYLVTRFQQNAAIMRGFFLLPEVFYEVIPARQLPAPLHGPPGRLRGDGRVRRVPHGLLLPL